MVWAPRCALLPLGAVRGEEGLNTWEYIAFAEACENRYRSMDDEDEAEEEERFLFEEAYAAENQRVQHQHEEEDYFSNNESWWGWDTGND